MTEPFITRFAPSPTGHLHTGHAFSVLEAYRMASQNKGTLLIRIEDIDHTRCKQEFTESILSDLKWLGIEYSDDIWFQSKKRNGYAKALEKLNSLGLTYPCYCTRKDIQEQVEIAPNHIKGQRGFYIR
ncbi:MAG: glutamate--tRNA ligase family protein [Sphingomonadales bacterium]